MMPPIGSQASPIFGPKPIFADSNIASWATGLAIVAREALIVQLRWGAVRKDDGSTGSGTGNPDLMVWTRPGEKQL